jgi:hypothetical protein
MRQSQPKKHSHWGRNPPIFILKKAVYVEKTCGFFGKRFLNYNNPKVPFEPSTDPGEK